MGRQQYLPECICDMFREFNWRISVKVYNSLIWAKYEYARNSCESNPAFFHVSHHHYLSCLANGLDRKAPVPFGRLQIDHEHYSSSFLLEQVFESCRCAFYINCIDTKVARLRVLYLSSHHFVLILGSWLLHLSLSLFDLCVDWGLHRFLYILNYFNYRWMTINSLILSLSLR